MPWLKPSAQESVTILSHIIQLCQEQPCRLTTQQCKILINHTPYFLLVPKFIWSTFPRHRFDFEQLELLIQDTVDLWTPTHLTLYAQLLEQLLEPAQPWVQPVDFPQRFQLLMLRLAPVFSLSLDQ